MQPVDWSAVLSTAAGGGTVLLLAKFILDRALSDLAELTRKVEDALMRLSAINVKLEAVERLRTTVTEHDRQIAVLDARSHLNAEFAATGRPPSNRPPRG